MTSESRLPEDVLRRLAINNQQEGVRAFMSIIQAEAGEMDTLRSMLVVPKKTNFQISLALHAHFNVVLEPASKMSPSYYICVPGLLRHQLFEEGDERVAAWRSSLAKRRGVEHPRSKINVGLPEFDQIIDTIRTSRLDGMGYPEIRTLLESKMYPTPDSIWRVVHSNPDLFPDLIEYDKAHTTTIRSRMLVRYRQEGTKVLPLVDQEDEAKFAELLRQIEFIEKMRIDDKLTWGEINLRLGKNTGKGAYGEWKLLRGRVRMFMELGYFTRLTADVERALQAQQTAESYKKQSSRFRKFNPEQEREIYELWGEARKKGVAVTTFAGNEARARGVAMRTIWKVIKRLDKGE